MSTKITLDKPHADHFKTLIFRLGVVFLFTLLIALGLLGAVRANRPEVAVRSANNERDEASAADHSSIGVDGDSQAASLPEPSELKSSRPKLEPLQPQSQTLINIDFNNVPPGTVISNQYPFVTFSTDPNFFL